jgi:hypothetical protein
MQHVGHLWNVLAKRAQACPTPIAILAQHATPRHFAQIRHTVVRPQTRSTSCARHNLPTAIAQQYTRPHTYTQSCDTLPVPEKKGEKKQIYPNTIIENFWTLLGVTPRPARRTLGGQISLYPPFVGFKIVSVSSATRGVGVDGGRWTGH